MPEMAFNRTINRFDSAQLRNMYPGIGAFQLEPGPLEGWIFSLPFEDFQLNAGTLNRTVLYEGTFHAGKECFGFIVDPHSSAAVQAHIYDNGTLDINMGDTHMHYVFPAGLVWVNMVFPKGFIEGCMGSHLGIEKRQQRLMLQGSREELQPLVTLVDVAMKQDGRIKSKERDRLRGGIKATLRDLMRIRIKDGILEHPYTDGDKFRMHVLEKCHAFEATSRHQPLRIETLCEATGIKRRTLQHYFTEAYGMGPMDYFRTRRLNEIRTELMYASGNHTRVSDVAGRWGFTHMGRFSQAYTRLFAENPSETLCLRNEVHPVARASSI